MRVGHVMDHMGLGGAQTIVRDLVDRNENHYLFALREADNQIEFNNPKSLDKVTIIRNRAKYSPLVVRDLKKFVEENKIDILHVHLIKSDIVVYMLKKRYPKLKVKFLFHEHSAICTDRKQYHRIVNLVKPKVDAFVAVSKECRELLDKKTDVNFDEVEVIYNYAYFGKLEFLSSKDKLDLRKEFGLAKDDFVIGYAGRLRPHKRVETIIEAFKILENSKAKLVICGDGDNREVLEDMAKDNSNIKLLGFRNDMKRIYQIFDCFVLASKSEGNPMVYFESQAYSVPFIGSDIKSILEVVHDGVDGLIFEFDKPKDLARQLDKLIKDKKLGERISKEGAKTLKEFSIEKFEENIQKVYDRLMN